MKRLFTFLGLLASGSAFAHPGHGHSEGFTITHYFVEPEHLFAMAVMTIAVIVLVKKFNSRFAKN